MTRIRLSAATLLLVAVPAAGSAGEPRIADVRVGQHGHYERIVVELESETEVAVRWLAGESREELFEIAARPLLARQRLSTGRPRVGEMLLESAEGGARLRLEAGERRLRAFLLADPPRLVIDVAAPAEAPFDPPEDVRAVYREERDDANRAEPAPAEVTPLAPQPLGPETAEQAVTDPAEEAVTPLAGPAAPEPVAVPAEPALPPEETSAPQVPVRERTSWLGSRAFVVPLLAGIGVMLLAVGGLALASAQRARPSRKRALVGARLDPGDAALRLSADRLDLLEKRVDEEVRARTQLEEQLARAREELGEMRELFSRLRAQAAARSAAPSAPQ